MSGMRETETTLREGRILLNDNQRRRLAVKGKALGHKALRGLATIVTPDTIPHWHRELVARKWDFSNLQKRIGRPRVREEIVRLVVQMANWTTFLRDHWEVLAAVDFTTIEVWTRDGLAAFHILVVRRLSTRRVEIAGVTPHPESL